MPFISYALAISNTGCTSIFFLPISQGFLGIKGVISKSSYPSLRTVSGGIYLWGNDSKLTKLKKKWVIGTFCKLPRNCGFVQ